MRMVLKDNRPVATENLFHYFNKKVISLAPAGGGVLALQGLCNLYLTENKQQKYVFLKGLQNSKIAWSIIFTGCPPSLFLSFFILIYA